MDARMKNPCVIPANFRVPKRFRHEFILFFESTKVGRIAGVPGEKQTIFETFDTPINASQQQRAEFNSRSLDWIQESVEHLRFLCQG